MWLKTAAWCRRPPDDLLTRLSNAVLVAVVGDFKRPFIILGLYHWLNYIPFLFYIRVDLFLLKSG